MSFYENSFSAVVFTLAFTVIIATGLFIIPMITATTPAPASSEPAVALSVDGDSLTPTESITVGSDPDLTLSVSVNESRELTAVRVAVDNETRQTYNNSTLNQTLNRELDITLGNGAHTIEVRTTTRTDARTNNTSTETATTTLASTGHSIDQTANTLILPHVSNSHETNTGSTDTYTNRFTVVVDTAAPFVKYTSPFETDAVAPPPEFPTVTNSTVVLAGTLQDRSAVTAVQITHIYEYDFAGRSQSTRSVYRLSPTNGSFVRPLVLGVGENEITAEYTDRFGNIRQHEITIRLVDLSAPQIILDSSIPSRIGYETLRIDGTVTDAVKLDQIDLLTPSSGTKRLLIQQGPEPTRKHRSVSISETVRLSPGRNYIQIDATDVNGNTREREATVFYDESIPPQITVESVAVSDSASQSPTVRVTGRIAREEIIEARIEIREVGTETTESVLLERSLMSTAKTDTDTDTDTDTQSTTNESQRQLQFDEEFILMNITNPVSLRVIASDTENDTEIVTRQVSSITAQTERDSESIDSSSPMQTSTPALTVTSTDTTPSSTALPTGSTASSRSSTSTPLGLIPVLAAGSVVTLLTMLATRLNRYR
jgi:hypothetical protein